MKIFSLLVLMLLSTTVNSQNDQPIVIQFVIDGLMKDAAETAIKAGATNLAYFAKNGVVVEDAYSISPMGRVKLPDGQEPWRGASPPNIGMHTGTHVFESQDLDDIFLSARRNGIKSVFVGGHTLYDVFQTPDIYYAELYSDSQVVDLAIKHIREDTARLVRLHLQKIRSSWTGPACKTDPDSDYIKAIIKADEELGKLVAFLKEAKLWKNSFFVISADHGMGTSPKSNHLPEQLSSWQIYMNFYGPGIKKGATIPYAESPDIAIMTNYFMGLPPLKGYTVKPKEVGIQGTTGIFLKNIFKRNSEDLDHPQWVKKYLDNNDESPANSYLDYRQAMLEFISE